MKLRVLIADDHAIIRKGLKQILLEEYPTATIDEVCDAEQVVRKLLHLEWDILICDLSMPGRSGLDVLHDVKQSFPHLPVLILSIHSEEQYAVRVLRAGAAGYLCKETAIDELMKAVRRILQGRKYISPSLAETLANELSADTTRQPHELLSDREYHVFKAIADGKSVSAIAQALSLSVTTVSTYRARILTKMGLKSNTDLTRYALEYKLI